VETRQVVDLVVLAQRKSRHVRRVIAAADGLSHGL
jgi:hypothetical protein